MSDESDVEVKFGASIDGIVAGISEVKEQIEGLAEFTEGITQTFSEIGEAIAAAFAIEQIEGFIEKLTDLGAKVDTASAQLGLSAEKIQGIDYAAQVSDMGIDQATRTIDKFYQSVQEAENPTTKQAAAFAAMGINVQEFLAKGGTLPELLDLTAQKLGSYADGANKSVLIMDLFGQRSAEAVRFVNTLSAGLDQLTNVQKALQAPSEENLAELQETHVRMTDLSVASENLAQSMAPIALAAVKVAEGFVQFLSIVGAVFSSLGTILDTALLEVADFATGTARLLSMAAHGASFAELKAAAADTFGNMKSDVQAASDTITATLENTKALLKELNDPALKGAGANNNGPAAPNPPPPHQADDSKDQMQAWQTQLDQMLAADQIYGDKAKAVEEQFWENKLALAQEGTKTYEDLTEKVYQFQNEAYEQDVQSNLAAYNEKEEAAKDDYSKVQQIEQQKLAYMLQVYGEDSKNYQDELKRKQQMDDQNVKATEQKYNQLFTSMFSSFNTAIKGMLQGSETFQQGMANVFEGILTSVVDILEKMAAKWLANQIVEQTSTEVSTRGAIQSSASQAGAAAYASTAAIPLVGPELAPAAGAAAYAGAMAYNLASYDVGAWNINADQIAKVHQGEMIVPARAADAWRDNMSGGPGSSGGGTQVVIQAMDAKSVSRLMRQNGGAIASAIANAARMGNPNVNAPR